MSDDPRATWISIIAEKRAVLATLRTVKGKSEAPSNPVDFRRTFEALCERYNQVRAQKLLVGFQRQFSPNDLNLLIQSCQDSFVATTLAPARLKKKSIMSGIFGKSRPFRSNSEELHQLARSDSNFSTCSSAIHKAERASPKESKSAKLRISHLTLPDEIQPHMIRQLAYYDDIPVLVEWRNVNRYDWERWEERASRFCDLLNEMAQDPSFHSLPCLGFVKEAETGRYGYVLVLAKDQATFVSSTHLRRCTRKPLPVVRTLKTQIDQSTSMPSLNIRVSFAIVLLETMLQLHTAEWLHKELRPENVLLVARNDDAFLDQDLLYSPMYLAGYIYARADDPREFTEPLRPAIEADLYRHPLSLLGNERRPYCRSFDIFSMGCILLELGLWSSMSTILHDFSRASGYFRSRPSTSQSFKNVTPPLSPTMDSDEQCTPDITIDRQILRRDLLTQVKVATSTPGGILEHLRAQVGRCFANIIAEFLNVQTSGWDAKSGMDESEYILDLEKRALCQLGELAEKL